MALSVICGPIASCAFIRSAVGMSKPRSILATASGTLDTAVRASTALLELGALTGEGRTHDGIHAKTGLWLAPGALVNLSVKADPVWLRLAFGAVFPVIWNKFQFKPNPVAFQADSIALSAEFEVAWAF
jgi:hypothetical protein